MEKNLIPQIRIDTGRVARNILIACLIMEFAFLLLDYFINYGRLTEIGAMRRMFNIAREDGFASWFASTQTFLTGLTLLVLYLASRVQNAGKLKRICWLVLACFFIIMAVDDGIQGHERFASTIKAMSSQDGSSFDFFPSYPWQLLFLPIFGGLGLFMLGFLWRELETTRARVLLLTACSAMALAAGLDFIEGLEPEHSLNVINKFAASADFGAWTEERFGKSAYDTLLHFSKAIEETLEMASISILWYIFIRHLGRARPESPSIQFI